MRTFFADSERDFILIPTLILELERKTGVGIGALVARVSQGAFHFADIIETIRLAMIGGGTLPQEADALVRAYVGTEGNPLIEAQILAIDILSRLYSGAPEGEANEAA